MKDFYYVPGPGDSFFFAGLGRLESGNAFTVLVLKFEAKYTPVLFNPTFSLS